MRAASDALPLYGAEEARQVKRSGNDDDDADLSSIGLVDYGFDEEQSAMTMRVHTLGSNTRIQAGPRSMPEYRDAPSGGLPIAPVSRGMKAWQ